MGAPTLDHEVRVGELETLAVLAGFTAAFELHWRLRPDVVRACPATGAVFFGDAKHTESPACAATRRRLRWYGVAAATLPAEVQAVTMALAVPALAPLSAWQETLILAAGRRMVCGTPVITLIGETAVITTRAKTN